MPSHPRLEEDFEREMHGIYEEAKRRFGYHATYYLRMLQDHGAVATAKRLVLETRRSDGLTFLWEQQALWLSVEALVLREPWRDLFEPHVLKAAEKKLRGLGYGEAGGAKSG